LVAARWQAVPGRRALAAGVACSIRALEHASRSVRGRAQTGSRQDHWFADGPYAETIAVLHAIVRRREAGPTATDLGLLLTSPVLLAICPLPARLVARRRRAGSGAHRCGRIRGSGIGHRTKNGRTRARGARHSTAAIRTGVGHRRGATAQAAVIVTTPVATGIADSGFRARVANRNGPRRVVRSCAGRRAAAVARAPQGRAAGCMRAEPPTVARWAVHIVRGSAIARSIRALDIGGAPTGSRQADTQPRRGQVREMIQ